MAINSTDSTEPPNSGRGDQNIAHGDGYLDWALRTEFAFLGGNRDWWIPLLVELREKVELQKFASQAFESRDDVFISSLYVNPTRSLSKARFCTLAVRREALNTVLAGPLFKDVLRYELGHPMVASDKSGIAPTQEKYVAGAGSAFAGAPRTQMLAQNEPSEATHSGSPLSPSSGGASAPTAQGHAGTGSSPIANASPTASGAIAGARRAGNPRVVVGVIDDGIAFAHRRFRTRNNDSRFKGFWNQEPLPGSTILPGIGAGWKLTQDQITALIKTHTSLPCGLVDEDRLYRSAGHNNVARGIAHGTHVADDACGMEPADVMPDSPLLVGVQLPSRVTRDTSGALLKTFVVDALHYIADCTDGSGSLGVPATTPLVINLSYGPTSGPHDGSSGLEAAIDDFVRNRSVDAPTTVVLGAGNHHLARMHARLDLAPQGAPAATQSLAWRLPPDDRTPSFLEIWLPRWPLGATRPNVRVRVETPAGIRSNWVGQGDTVPLTQNGVAIGRIAYLLAVFSADRDSIRIDLNPNEGNDPPVAHAPCGTWKIEIDNLGDQAELHAYIARDDPPLGYRRRGRQSRFEDAAYRVYHPISGDLLEHDQPASRVKRANTLSGIATGEKTIVVGGAIGRKLRASRYSACGPGLADATGGFRPGPSAVSASDASLALPGRLAAGTRSAGAVPMNGTSVAAPQVTRFAAAVLAAGGVLTNANIGGMTKAVPGGPAARVGFGLVDVAGLERKPRR